MEITVTKENGKSIGRVHQGDRVFHITPGYYTNQMALAAAHCWAAFHWKGEGMDKVEVDLSEVYTVAQSGTGVFCEFPAERVARAVAQAYEFGLDVEIKQGAMGQRYIQIGRKGVCSYGQYHMGADFRDRMVPGASLPSVALTPNDVQMRTRPEYYGTPSYFSKLETFDVFDRDTDALLPWEVRRVDGDVIVNGPKGYVQTGLKSLREAAELIAAQR